MSEPIKKCSVTMAGGEPCGLTLANDKVCLFHLDNTGKGADFARMLQDKIDKDFSDPEVSVVDFTGYVFPPFDFPQTFPKNTVFKRCRFKDRIIFQECFFRGSVDFSEATFEKGVEFVRCEFSGKSILFADSNFCGPSVRFVRNKFHNEFTGFDEARFSAERVEFTGKALADLANRAAKTNLGRRVSMRGLTIDHPNQFSFKHIDLTNVELRGTDLRHLHFVDVGWFKIRRRRFPFKELKSLYDEKSETFQANNYADVALLENSYRQLRMNHEESRNFGEAGDFFFGEMEMLKLRQIIRTIWTKKWTSCWRLLSRKLKKGEDWRSLFSSLMNMFGKGKKLLPAFVTWRALYRLSSGYGQLWGNSLALIVALMSISTLLLMLTGVEIPGVGTVKYEITWLVQDIAPALEGFANVFLHNLIMVFRSTPNATTLTARFVVVVQMILLPILVTLLVLSLRQRFKR